MWSDNDSRSKVNKSVRIEAMQRSFLVIFFSTFVLKCGYVHFYVERNSAVGFPRRRWAEVVAYT